MELEKIVARIVQEAIQEKAYKISDLCETYNSEETVFFLVAEQLHIRTLVPLLSEKDRVIFDKLVACAETTALPKAFDPRDKGAE